jgi:hypothetical protein
MDATDRPQPVVRWNALKIFGRRPCSSGSVRVSWRSIWCYPIKVTGNEPQTAMAWPAWRDAGDRRKVNGAIPPGVSMMSLELTADTRAIGQSPPAGRQRLMSVVSMVVRDPTLLGFHSPLSTEE